MGQSNTIFGFFALAFIVFITMRGELPLYMGFLLGNPKPATNPSGVQTVSPGNETAEKIQSDTQSRAKQNLQNTINLGSKLILGF